MRDLKDIISANEEAYERFQKSLVDFKKEEQRRKLADKHAEEMILREISKSR